MRAHLFTADSACLNQVPDKTFTGIDSAHDHYQGCNGAHVLQFSEELHTSFQKQNFLVLMQEYFVLLIPKSVNQVSKAACAKQEFTGEHLLDHQTFTNRKLYGYC